MDKTLSRRVTLSAYALSLDENDGWHTFRFDLPCCAHHGTASRRELLFNVAYTGSGLHSGDMRYPSFLEFIARLAQVPAVSSSFTRHVGDL